MLDSRTESLLRIYRTKNIGPISFYNLYKKYKEPYLMENELKQRGIELIDKELVRKEIAETYAFGAEIIFFEDPEYPKSLKECRDAPVFLIVKGNISLLNTRLFSIVGARNASIHGKRIAQEMAGAIEQAGYTVVSGMAHGIDRNAHLGTKANTIAVLANGISHVYPPENRDIYEKMCQNSLVITEQPITSCDRLANLFHARNRIIAGLGQGLLVVEATKNSGSLITANCALDYNKEIFAIPGCPLDQRSYGPNSLIQKGATLVQTVDDILFNLGSEHTLKPLDNSLEQEEKPILQDLASKILNLLSATPVKVDELHAVLKCKIGEIRATLIELEMQGLVAHTIAGTVVRI